MVKFTMCDIQSTLSRNAKNKEDIANGETNKSCQTNHELIQVLELAYKDAIKFE